MRFSILTGLCLAATALAAPLEAREPSTTCGKNYYSSTQVRDAVNRGYGDYANHGTAGGSTYPHQYNNYEGFDFPVPGPYQEFPIEESGVYNGGSPGADRVIFNTKGDFAGAVTHTGASGNNFVGCSGTS